METRHRMIRRTILHEGRREALLGGSCGATIRAPRDGAARRVRMALRRLRPVILTTPRWSAVSAFLSDLEEDLAIGEGRVRIERAALHTLRGGTPAAWGTLLRLVASACPLGPTRLAQPVDRKGFRYILAELLQAAGEGAPRALALHGVETVPMEALEDLVQGFDARRKELKGKNRFTLLLAGSVPLPGLTPSGGVRMDLPDYGPEEAVQALVERLGPRDPRLLRGIVELVGGVPSLIEAVGHIGRDALSLDRHRILRSMGALSDEIRGAVSIVVSDGDLAERLDEVVRTTRSPWVAPHDTALLAAGLVRRENHRGVPHAVVRSSLFTHAVRADA